MTLPVAVYGATGYTGRLAARALADRNVDLVLAGRDRDRLRRARDHLELDAGVRVAAADDVDRLTTILDEVDAVVDTAGPFLAVGDGVARAAVRASVPYVDSTGEQVFAKRLADTLDGPARDAGVPLVPMLAFEYALGDLVAAELIGERSCRRLDVTYKVDHGVASAGTVKSILEAAARSGWWWRGGGLAPIVPAEATRTVELDGRDLDAYGFPGGEALTVPRHRDVRTVRTFMVAHPRTIARLQRFGPLARQLLGGPVGGLAKGLVDRFHDDPSPDERGGATGRVVLEAETSDGDRRRTVVEVQDPYAVTAHLLAEGAVRLGRDTGSAAGVVAPAEALDVPGFLDAVGKHHPSLSRGDVGTG